MKKTLFIALFTAALVGSQVLAEEFIPTTVTGATKVEGWVYAGSYSTTDDVSGGAVTIQEDLALGDDLSGCDVYGGRTVGDGKIATNNSVTISGGEVGFVCGGSSEGGSVSGNTVDMTGGEVEGAVLGGNVEESGDAIGNTVTITDGYVYLDVYGGCTYSGDATGNTVDMTGGEVEGAVIGGCVQDTGEASGNTVSITDGLVYYVYGGSAYSSGNVSENEVTINGGYVYNDVFGGFTISGGATSNTVTMNDGQVSYVYGGYVDESGSATYNTVTMNNGHVYSDVFGGYTISGEASYNTVTMNDGQVSYVYGGYVDEDGSATCNTVTMNGGYVYNDVFGGFTRSGDATGNSLTMTGGEVAESVYGGYVEDSGDATGNTVTMTSGEVGSDVYGGCVGGTGDATGNTVGMTDGYVRCYVFGGWTYSGDVTDNTVTMSGGHVHYDVNGGHVYDTGDATGNSLTMTGGVVDGYVYGGETNSGNATDNTVTMSGGEVDGDVYGGCVDNSGDATGNTVTMSGGYVHYDVYGGHVQDTGDATGNTVTMSGGEVAADVYGGVTASGEASGNAIHLVGEGASYTVGDTTYKGGKIAIQGGVHAGYVEAGGVSSNNSVHIHGTGISVGGTIDSCQMLNFHIVQGQAGAQGTPMVTLGGNDSIGLDLDGVELGFYGDAVTDWAAFNGKSITLVSMTNETITGLVTPTDPVDITDEAGNTVATSTLELSEDGKVLTLTNIQGVGPVPPPPPPVPTVGPDALDVTLVNSLWASSAYVREYVRLAESQGYALKAGDTAVWGGGFGTFMHTTGDKGFKSDGGGYGIGVNHAFSANTQAGLSFGQGFGSYHNSGADGATVHQRAILAAATASTRIGKDFSLGGHLAFGNVRNRADCRLDGAPTERARWNDNVFNLGARAAYDFHVTETTAVTPFLGLDWMNGAHESFGGAYGRHYTHGRLNELRMPVGVTVSTATEVGSTKLLPQLSVAYVPAIAQQNPHANVSTNGTDYRVKGYAPGRNAFMLNVGMNAIFSENWSAGASYTLETRRHAVDQSVNASVRYTF